MEIIEIPIDELHEYENNPRNNDNAVSAVAASIAEFGFKKPIIIDKNYVIIAGHTRLKAARTLGLEKVPCIMADDMTPEQVKAYRLADNKVSEFAKWDNEKLEQENEKITTIDMEKFGFLDREEHDIDSFFIDAEPKEKERERIQCPDCGEWFYLDEAEDADDEDY